MKKIPFSYSTFPNIYRKARRKAKRNNTSIAKVLHGFLETYVADEPELPEDSVPIEYASLNARSGRRRTAGEVDGAIGEAGGDVVTLLQNHAEEPPIIETILPEHEAVSKSDAISEGFSGSVTDSEDVINGETSIDGLADSDHFASDIQTEATDSAAEVSFETQVLDGSTEEDGIWEAGPAPAADIEGPFAKAFGSARAGLKKKGVLNKKKRATVGKVTTVKGRSSNAKPAKGKATKSRKNAKLAK